MSRRTQRIEPRAADSTRAALSFFLLLALTGTSAPAARAGAEERIGAAGLRERLGVEWTASRTPSVRVFTRPDRVPAPARLAAVEARVLGLARRLQLPDSALAQLRRDPIDYFLVDDPRVMEGFGAGDIEGLAYPESRLVVSTRLPHEHELVHVLVPLLVTGRPTANQPFLQEGLASLLGGNGADAEYAVLAHAATVLERGQVELAGLWTARGWRGSALNAFDRYAIAARFLQFLVESRGGMTKLRELARLLAGREEDVDARPWSAIRVQLEGVYDTQWDELELDFHAWHRTHAVAGLLEIAEPARAADLVAADDRHVARIWVEPDAWVVALAAHRGPLDAELYWGAPRPPTNAVTAAPGSGHRMRLHVDESGIELVDRHSARVLLRCAWPGVASGTGAVAPTAIHRNERVFRFGGPILEELDPPVSVGVWSRPIFEPR